jgi:hypothetical protein
MKDKPIGTYKAACKVQGIDPNKFPDFSMFPVHLQKFFIAAIKLAVIFDTIRKRWEPDWGNAQQEKYYNWFEIVPAKTGSGFVFSITYATGTNATVGAAFAFETREQAEFAAKQPEILRLYKDFMLLPTKTEQRQMKLNLLLK